MTATMSACSNRAQIFESPEGGWFSKPIDFFAKPEWAQTANPAAIELGSTVPVAAEDLVNTDGSCAAKVEVSQTAEISSSAITQASSHPAASAASNNGGAVSSAPEPVGAGAQNLPVLGGIALGMSECEAVRHAGSPNNVAISTGEQGERKAVLTYAGGSWPGIYTFSAGRLKVVDAVPEPEKSKKALSKKKKTPMHAQSAAQASVNRVDVQ
jgi:hypothetical protein